MFVPGTRTVVSVIVGGLSLTACFTTTADFGDDAEDFIVSDEALRAALFPETDGEFTEASCVEPTNRDEGTTFPCAAIDSEGGSWEFEVEITGADGYLVNVSRFPSG